MAFLGLLRDTPGVPEGLPIGPEASALLGTLVLKPVDVMMRRRGVPFVRYVDDLVMFCQSENDFLMLADEIAAQLGHLGQDLNWAKNEYHNCDADVSDVARASLDDESDFEGEGKSSDLRAALEAGDEGRVRFLLGGLRFNADPSGIAPLVKYRWAIRELPRQTVQYLGVVRDAIDDWAWLHEELLAGHEPRRALGRCKSRACSGERRSLLRSAQRCLSLPWGWIRVHLDR